MPGGDEVGFFKSSRGLQEQVDSLAAAVEDLAKCCEGNSRFSERANSDLKSMRADIDLQWEKVNRAIGRFAKRDAVAATTPEAESDGPADIDEINRRILRGEWVG